MAITTYSELQAAVASWLKRSDMASRIPEFISLAEARLNRKLRKRQAETDQSLAGVIGSRYVTLPATFSEALNLWIVDGQGRRPLERFMDPALLETFADRGEPRWWTIDGVNLAFERPCDQAYSFTLRMVAKYALSEASPTNSLLTDAPDLYLAATMVEAAKFTRDVELGAVWDASYRRAIAELNAQDARSRGLQTLSTEAGQLQWSDRSGGYSIYRDR